MEGAKALPTGRPSALQLDVSLDHLDDVRPVSNFADFFARQERQKATHAASKRGPFIAQRKPESSESTPEKGRTPYVLYNPIFSGHPDYQTPPHATLRPSFQPRCKHPASPRPLTLTGKRALSARSALCLRALPRRFRRRAVPAGDSSGNSPPRGGLSTPLLGGSVGGCITPPPSLTLAPLELDLVGALEDDELDATVLAPAVLVVAGADGLGLAVAA